MARNRRQHNARLYHGTNITRHRLDCHGRVARQGKVGVTTRFRTQWIYPKQKALGGLYYWVFPAFVQGGGGGGVDIPEILS